MSDADIIKVSQLVVRRGLSPTSYFDRSDRRSECGAGTLHRIAGRSARPGAAETMERGANQGPGRCLVPYSNRIDRKTWNSPAAVRNIAGMETCWWIRPGSQVQKNDSHIVRKTSRLLRTLNDSSCKRRSRA
jgi:hypothetical protein